MRKPYLTRVRDATLRTICVKRRMESDNKKKIVSVTVLAMMIAGMTMVVVPKNAQADSGDFVVPQKLGEMSVQATGDWTLIATGYGYGTNTNAVNGYMWGCTYQFRDVRGTPLEDPYTDSRLWASDICNGPDTTIVKVDRWDGPTQTLKTYNRGQVLTADFKIMYGVAYKLYTNATDWIHIGFYYDALRGHIPPLPSWELSQIWVFGGETNFPIYGGTNWMAICSEKAPEEFVTYTAGDMLLNNYRYAKHRMIVWSDTVTWIKAEEFIPGPPSQYVWSYCAQPPGGHSWNLETMGGFSSYQYIEVRDSRYTGWIVWV